MKKLFFSMAAFMSCLAVMFVFNSCSKEDNKESDEGSKKVQELSKWLNLDENGECPYICNEQGEFFLGADNQADATILAWNMSLGASETGSLTLPDNLGSIRVSTPTDPNGFYYDISYNVKGISVKKLYIISNEVLENGGDNYSVTGVYYQPVNGDRLTTYVCNNDNGNCGKSFTVATRPTACPHCGGSIHKR